MGLYLPGMTLPKEGERALWLVVHHEGIVEYEKDGWRTARNAIPVPDHGRLGDLDKLEGEMRLLAKHQTGYRQQGILGCCETVRSAPAVIPADRKEEDA